jgi:hypothetical protein
MVLTFVLVPFATQHSRRGGSGLRLMVSVLLGLGFVVLDQVTSSMGLLYGWHPAVTASLPTASLDALAWWNIGAQWLSSCDGQRIRPAHRGQRNNPVNPCSDVTFDQGDI